MSDADQQGSASQRIAVLEKRLASLHDLGVDTVGLRSQLAFARTQLAEGRLEDVLAICDEIEETARRLADGSGGEKRVRTGRFTRDQLSEAIKEILSTGMLAKLLAEQRGGPDIRLEARLRDIEDRVRAQMASETDALRAEHQVIREEIEQMRRSIGTATPTAEEPESSPADVAKTNEQKTAEPKTAEPKTKTNPNKEPLWAARLHSILVKAIRRADAQAAQISDIVKQFATQAGASADSMGPAVEALRASVNDDFKHLVDRIPTIDDHEPAWMPVLISSLQAVADRVRMEPRGQDATARTATASRRDDIDHDLQPTDVIHANSDANSDGTTDKKAPPADVADVEVETLAEAVDPHWTGPLVTSLNAIVERLQTPPGGEQQEPAWTAPLVASLQAVVERVQAPPAINDVAASAETNKEPAWVGALVDNLHAMVEKLQTAQHQPEATDLAAALGAVVERGLAGLGELIREQGNQSARIGQPVDDTSAALSPVTIPVQEEGTTRAFGNASTHAKHMGVAITPALSDSLRSLVMYEIEARLGHGQTSAFDAKELKPEQLRAMVAAEFDRRSGGAIERNDVNDLRANFVRLLPDLLNDEMVRQQLFAVLALEMISKPGALAELTGLRTFLKQELTRAAEEIAGRMQPI